MIMLAFMDYVKGTEREKFVDWCLRSGMVITKTQFKYHSQHLWTWTIPKNNYRNQINYGCINNCSRNLSWCSDHVPVLINAQIKLKKIKKKSVRVVRQLSELKEKDVRHIITLRFKTYMKFYNSMIRKAIKMRTAMAARDKIDSRKQQRRQMRPFSPRGRKEEERIDEKVHP